MGGTLEVVCALLESRSRSVAAAAAASRFETGNKRKRGVFCRMGGWGVGEVGFSSVMGGVHAIVLSGNPGDGRTDLCVSMHGSSPGGSIFVARHRRKTNFIPNQSWSMM